MPLRARRRDHPRRRFLPALLAAIVLASVATLTTPAGPQAARAADDAPRADCRGFGDVIPTADDLLANRYTLDPHPTVELPADPAWNENPLNDRNWQYQYHSQRYVRTLLHAFLSTGDEAYRDRGSWLLHDWLQDNPRSNPPSIFSWNDHATAWRAMTLVCAAEVIGLPDWLANGLDLHGKVLADPAFYVKHGNHALNQALALLDVGCLRERDDWLALARLRLEGLVIESVDSYGVTNEQAVEYQAYNYRQYSSAKARLAACGEPPGSAFDRVAKMPKFLAHATLPNGEYELIGDTSLGSAFRIPGTIAEFAATKGESGPRPPVDTIIYRLAGWAFARTGWGTARAYEDEVHTSLRFGPKRQIHGHYDGGSVTLYGYGKRLLVDSGKYRYEADKWRPWFMGRTAHNVVSVDGLTTRIDGTTPLIAHRTSTRHTETIVSNSNYSGVTNRRRVIFSRKLGYLLVEDRLSSTKTRRFRQNWHLDADMAPAIGTSGVLTRRARGNLVIRQLLSGSTTRIVIGATSPIQGWISREYGSRIKAPVVEAIRSGTSVRYLTLVVPGAAAPKVRVGSLRVTSTGFSVVITVNGRSEQVTVTSTSSSIRTPAT